MDMPHAPELFADPELETAAPETAAPETAAPETAAPETAASEQSPGQAEHGGAAQFAVPVNPEATGDPLRGARTVKVGGPPGTGKTTWLLSTLQRALNEGIELDGHYAVEPDQVTVVTFTRAAATTVRQRLELGGGDEAGHAQIRVGTLHALAIEELVHQGVKVQLARQGALLKDWNERYPQWKLSAQGQDGQDEARATLADDMMGRIELLRARQVPADEWRAHLDSSLKQVRRASTPSTDEHLNMWRIYSEWKERSGAMDFSDVIEQAAQYPRPGMLLMIDEAQDFSPLELGLVQMWSQGFARTIFVGDDDQSIYEGLKGANPEAFATLEAERTIILEQSWRVPAQVQRFAERLLDGIDPARRWKKDYRPRGESGLLALSPATWEEPEPLLPLLEAATARAQRGEPAEVMLLAHARRMLEPTMLMLKRAGIPYHNPYAFNGAWTPLPVLSGERAGARERVLAFAHPGERNVTQLQRATASLAASGAFVRGQARLFREELKRLIEEDPLQPAPAALEEAMSPELIAALEARDLDWMSAHLESAARKVASWQVAFDLAARGRLEMTPAVILGTIHSVKGGEADHVVLFSDLTEARPELDEETLRLMYVGSTRSRHGLIITTPCARGLPVEALVRGHGKQT